MNEAAAARRHAALASRVALAGSARSACRRFRTVGGWLVGISLTASAPARAESAAESEPSRAPSAPTPTLWQEADALKYELAGLFLIISASGFDEWKWGTAPFSFNSEGWFGMRTGSGGQDKVGHAFSSYLMTEFLFLERRVWHGRRPVSVYPPLFVLALMTYVEVFDGFSEDHGFAWEDIVMDSAGVGLSWLRNLYPPLGRAVDFRMEYQPSAGMSGMHPMIDYSGQKFLLALSPGGAGLLPTSPLRYGELLLGYYTRGFMPGDAGHFADQQAHVFLGVGVDLEQVVVDSMGITDAWTGTVYEYGISVLRYFQVPNSYVSGTVHERRRPR